MDEQQEAKKGSSKILWLLVALMIVLVWWFFRPQHDPGAGAAQEQADATSAQTDPDDVLVDLKDDASPQTIATLERDLGIDLVLVDDTAKSTKLFRAHVDPAREAGILARLAARPE